MRRDELRALQAPLKERYREQPEAAVVTLSAEGTLGEGLTCSVRTGQALMQRSGSAPESGQALMQRSGSAPEPDQALARAGLHPATGGDGRSLCSGDMLLEALAACAGVTLSSVATALEIDVRAGQVHVEGDLDFRGTLAVSKDAPVGFRAIRLRFDLDTDATAEELDRLLRLTERYCVVLQTLRGGATLSAAIGTTGASVPAEGQAPAR